MKAEAMCTYTADTSNFKKYKSNGIYKSVQLRGNQYHKKYSHIKRMYSLPPHFNTGLLNSTFKLPVPVPLDISPANERPLQGMFDTNQFALERIFFDRMDGPFLEVFSSRTPQRRFWGKGMCYFTPPKKRPLPAMPHNHVRAGGSLHPLPI